MKEKDKIMSFSDLVDEMVRLQNEIKNHLPKKEHKKISDLIAMSVMYGGLTMRERATTVTEQCDTYHAPECESIKRQ